MARSRVLMPACGVPHGRFRPSQNAASVILLREDSALPLSYGGAPSAALAVWGCLLSTHSRAVATIDGWWQLRVAPGGIAATTFACPKTAARALALMYPCVVARNTGKGSRTGAVTRRVQALNPATGRYVKIDTMTGRIVDNKKTAGPYKGVREIKRKRSKG